MMTEHKFHIGSSCDMQELEDNSIELVVTSPPHPMIEMWDNHRNQQKNYSHCKKYIVMVKDIVSNEEVNRSEENER